MTLKTIFSVFAIISLGINSLLSQPHIQWQHTYGGSSYDTPYSVIQARNGNYIVAGTASSEDGDVGNLFQYDDIWILCLDSTGKVLWNKVYGGSDLDGAFAIIETNDSGFIVAGYTASNNGDVMGYHGYYDAWVIKLDSNGMMQWQKCLGGSGWEEAWSIDQTIDGGYVIAGRSGTPDGDATGNHGSLDYWVVKLDSVGQIQWQKSFGGSLLDLAYSVKQTKDGGYIVAGESRSADGDIIEAHGNADYWILKLNFEGKIEWQKSLGGTALDRANKIIQTSEGDYIVIGQSYSNNGNVLGAHGKYDYWVVRLSIDGKIIWQKALGGTNDDYGRSIQQTQDGGFILAGQTQSTNGDVIGNDGGADFWIVKLMSDGQISWQQSLGGSLAEWANDIVQTNDQKCLVAGYAWSNNGDVTGVQGKTDYWIVKLSAENTSTTFPHTSQLQIHPNPTQQWISIQWPQNETEIQLRITDTYGRTILEKRMSAFDSLDVSTLPKGFYMIEGTGARGQHYAGKLAVE